MTLFNEIWYTFINLLTSPLNHGWWQFVLKFIPFVIFFELPVYLLILLGILRYYIRIIHEVPERRAYYPKISCIITCYSEGKDVAKTIVSLAEQIYMGQIEMLAVIDGAKDNFETFIVAENMHSYVRDIPKRSLKVIPKWQRGGRVSSLNTGLNLSTGEIVMALDGDTSFDNTMVNNSTKHFADPNIVGVAGSLRVRNASKNLVTKLQALEYCLSIHASKVGLSEFNIVNNISGAFGIFRKSFLKKIGGWDSGTAEDLDITLRIKNYFGRHPELRILFDPKAMGHTDAPDTFVDFFKQRLRWDGDLFYLYIRKHFKSFSPRILGWRNLVMVLWTGIFFQIVMPFIILAYTLFAFTLFPAGYILGILALVYLFYFIITTAMYLAFLLMISERSKEDLKLAYLLPIFPFFTFFVRIWNAIASLKEIFMKSHLDSSMAPWWVLKKTKF